MQFALLIYYAAEVDFDAPASAALKQQTMAKHMAFHDVLGAKRLGGAGLRPTNQAKTVRFDGPRRSVHDGPFAETKEQLAGFYLIEARDMAEALDIAAKVPMRENGSVEVRQALGG